MPNGIECIFIGNKDLRIVSTEMSLNIKSNIIILQTKELDGITQKVGSDKDRAIPQHVKGQVEKTAKVTEKEWLKNLEDNFLSLLKGLQSLSAFFP